MKLKKLGMALLAASVIGVAPAFADEPQIWEKVQVTGSRTDFSFEQMFEDLKAWLFGEYSLNPNGDIMTSDPVIATNQTDARCNYKTSLNATGVTSASPLLSKMAVGVAVLNQLKGNAANGGFPAGGWATEWGQLHRGNVSLSTGGMLTNVKLLTIFYQDGSSSTFALSGANAAAAAIQGHVKDNLAVVYDWETGQIINPAACPA